MNDLSSDSFDSQDVEYDVGEANFLRFVDPKTPTPAEKPGYLSQMGGAFTSGIKDTAANLAFAGTAVDVISPELTVDILRYVENSPRFKDEGVDTLLSKYSKESEDIGREWDAGNKISAAGQVVDLGATALWHTISSPRSTSLALTNQAGNLIASYLPALAMGAAGTATPIPGAGPVGTAAGLFSGSALVEFGAAVRDKVLEVGGDPTDDKAVLAILNNPQVMDEIKQGAAKRGVSIAATDLIASALGLKILKGTKKLPDSDSLDRVSLTGRTAGASGLGMLSGGTGEALGSYAQEGKVDWKEVGPEVGLGGIQVLTDTAVLSSQLKADALKRTPTVETTTTLPDSQVADTIKNAPTIEDAIAIAEDVSSRDTNVLETQVPEAVVPEVDIPQLVDEDLQAESEVKYSLPDSITPTKKSYFESEQEATLIRDARVANYTGLLKSEMQSFMPVERFPDQWVLERQKPEKIRKQQEAVAKSQSVAESQSAKTTPFVEGVRSPRKSLDGATVPAAFSDAESQFVEQGVRGKPFKEAVSWLVENTQRPEYKQVGERVIAKLQALSDLNIPFTFEVLDPKKKNNELPSNTPAANIQSVNPYASSDMPGLRGNRVLAKSSKFRGDTGMSFESLMHEAIHSITQYQLFVGQKESDADLNTQAAQWYDDMSDLRGHVMIAIAKTPDLLKGTRFEGKVKDVRKTQLEDTMEMMSYGMTDPDFQTILKRIPYQGRISSWDRFVIIMRKSLGMDRTDDSALSALMQRFAEISDVEAELPGYTKPPAKVEVAPKEEVKAEPVVEAKVEPKVDPVVAEQKVAKKPKDKKPKVEKVESKPEKKGVNWRIGYAQEKDPFQKASILRVIAEMDHSSKNLSFILDKAEGLVSDAGGKVRDVYWEIASNSQNPKEIQSRAKTLYDNFEIEVRPEPKREIQAESLFDSLPEQAGEANPDLTPKTGYYSSQGVAFADLRKRKSEADKTGDTEYRDRLKSYKPVETPEGWVLRHKDSVEVSKSITNPTGKSGKIDLSEAYDELEKTSTQDLLKELNAYAKDQKERDSNDFKTNESPQDVQRTITGKPVANRDWIKTTRVSRTGKLEGQQVPIVVHFGGDQKLKVSNLFSNSPTTLREMGVAFDRSFDEAKARGNETTSAYLNISNPIIFTDPAKIPKFANSEAGRLYKKKMMAASKDGVIIDMTKIGGDIQYIVFSANQIMPVEGSVEVKKFVTQGAETSVVDKVSEFTKIKNKNKASQILDKIKFINHQRIASELADLEVESKSKSSMVETWHQWDNIPESIIKDIENRDLTFSEAEDVYLKEVQSSLNESGGNIKVENVIKFLNSITKAKESFLEKVSETSGELSFLAKLELNVRKVPDDIITKYTRTTSYTYPEQAKLQELRDEKSKEVLDSRTEVQHEEARKKWKAENAVVVPKGAIPETRKAAEDYYYENLSWEEFRDVLDEIDPITPLSEIPEIPSFEDLFYGLNTNQVSEKSGIVGYNHPGIPDGTKVGARLDIPLYERYGKHVATISGKDTPRKTQYARTAVLKDVTLKVDPDQALDIAKGFKEKEVKGALKRNPVSKSPMAVMEGSWVDLDSGTARALAQEWFGKPGVVQVGYNPRRRGQFYDKANALPITGADEVVQIGNLVLAKGVKYGDPMDPALMATSASGELIRFHRQMKEESVAEEGIPIKESTPYSRAIEAFNNKIVDSYFTPRKVQKAIESVKGKLADHLNLDQALTLFPGTTRSKIDDFVNTYQQPLADMVRDSGLTWREAAEFLHARHAAEANEVLAERNPEHPDKDRLSGMTNANAETILEKYKDNAKVQKIGKFNDLMANVFIDESVKAGLLSDAEAASWRQNSEHYVPLHRSEMDTFGGASRGQGFDVRGKNAKIRAGSVREVDYDNMFAHIMQQNITRIVREGKNTVSKTLWNMAKTNPDSTFWETDVNKFPEDVKRLLKDGTISSSTNMNALNILSHKVNGENRYIWLNDRNEVGKKMANAMRNLDKAAPGKFVETIAKFTRFLSAVITTYNPEFMLTNPLRDIQTAMYNMTDTQIAGFQKDVLKNLKASGMGIRDALRGENTTEMAALFDEMRRNGGTVGWLEAHHTAPEYMKTLQRDLTGFTVGGKKVPAQADVKNLLKLMEDYNTVFENAVRLSAYKVAKDNGLTGKQAAQIAKQLTVDFNQKGEWGTVVNAWYLFFNASVQGTARMFKASLDKKNTKIRKLMGATIAAAAISDMMNRLLADDEDEYNKLVERYGSRTWLIKDMFGLTDDGYFKIPAPYGYNILLILGQESSAMAAHAFGMNKTWNPIWSSGNLIDTVGNILTSRVVMGAVESFNPVNSGSWAEMMSPTITDPSARIWANADWHGGPLYPNYSPSAKNYTKYYSGARESSIEFTKWLYNNTQDKSTLSGGIDWSPEWVDMYLDFIAGGAGKFLMDTGSLVFKASEGEMPALKEVPVARRFYGEIDAGARKTMYYDKMYEITDLGVNLSQMERTWPKDDYEEVKAHIDPKRLKLLPKAKDARREVDRYKKLIAIAEKSGDKEKVKMLDEKMTKRMTEFSREYNTLLYGVEY